MSSNAMLPLLLMDSDSDNSQLIMFMGMMNNQNCYPMQLLSNAPGTPESQFETETALSRTVRSWNWKLIADGTRTRVHERR